jgi:hypothetical protein
VEVSPFKLKNRYFELLIMSCIIANSIALAIYDYKDRSNKTYYNKLLNLIGMCFTGIYFMECCLKIVAMGFFLGKNSYLRSFWGWLDLTIVIVGIIDYYLSAESSFKSLRILRAFRPLKSITSVKSVKKIVSSLLVSLP